MLDKLILFIEKVIEWNEGCTTKWWRLARILSFPVIIIGMIFLKIVILLRFIKTSI